MPGTIETLNGFLRAEISAVELYAQALTKVADKDAREELETASRSHQARVETLRARIEALGGTPTESSGAWGAFTKLVEQGAALIGDRASIAILEEGEDHGLRAYAVDLSLLDPESRRIVEHDLLPAQQSSHRALSSLKAALH